MWQSVSLPFGVCFVKRILNRFSSLKMSSATAEIASCKCSGVCSRKDGSKAKGCPCKTRGEFCSASCKCLLTGKRCQNQVGFHFFFRHRFSPLISFINIIVTATMDRQKHINFMSALFKLKFLPSVRCVYKCFPLLRWPHR